MKFYWPFLNTFILLFVFSYVSAQHTSNWCGTAHTEAFMERLKSNKDAYYNNPLRLEDREPVYIPLQIQIVSDNNGNGGAQEIDLARFLGHLNEFYLDYDMQFFFPEKDGSAFNYFSSQAAYNEPNGSFGELDMDLNRNLSAINMYIINVINLGGTFDGTVAGYYDPGPDWIVTTKGYARPGLNVLIHEVGHYFSLAHPHYGWECQGYDQAIHGNPLESDYSFCESTFGPVNALATTFEAELVDRSNCEETGDLLCDTPPDYNFGISWASCNPFNLNIKDPNGDIIYPMQNNVMSYFPECNDHEYTAMQRAIINEDFNSPARAYIRGTYNPNIDIVDSTINYSFPLNDEIVDANDPVTFEWEEDPSVDYYVFLIARNAGLTVQRQKFIIQTNELTLDNLVNDKTYYYSVFGFNVTGNHTIDTETIKFTSSSLTATKNLEDISSLQVKPNPISSKQNLYIVINSNQSFASNISLKSIDGKEIKHFKHALASGTNSLEIDISKAPAGMYFISVETPNGIRSKKLIITD